MFNCTTQKNRWFSCALAMLIVVTMLMGRLPAVASQTNAPIPWDQIGAVAGQQYQGDGLAVAGMAEGARLRCVFQKLEGRVTSDGLWLASTVAEAKSGDFRVIARSVGRTAGPQRMLAVTGEVATGENLVRFTRPGLTEEYSVSMDGVRQDFIVEQRPDGQGALRVELEAAGARAEGVKRGILLTLNGAGRKLVYGRLRVEDAQGKPLPARLEAESESRLTIVVEDAGAVYPVRIDPTFSDANWTSLGNLPGADGAVNAIAVDGSGNVYVGGAFTVMVDVVANRVAKWNGSSWSALGTGLDGTVNALAISGSDLYVGGVFTAAGGAPANYIAKWNGSAWSALGTGFNWDVFALAFIGTDLYAAGKFTTAGGNSAARVAKWNGSAWSALGTGVSGPVQGGWVSALAVSSTNLYVGGNFDTAGGNPAAYIAKWNGTAWSTLGTGMGNQVQALTMLGTNLYAGGAFLTAGGNSASYIAKWNGTAWSPLGSGLSDWVYALAGSGTNLYVGGKFITAGGFGATNIAKWNGTAWSALGQGANDWVFALGLSGTNVYVGGQFTTAGGLAANRIAKWNGTAWTGWGSGMNGQVQALAVMGTNLYAGGKFTTAGGVAASYIAKWDGAAWSAVGSGVNNTVLALTVSGTNLYAGGLFTVAGSVGASRIAKWNGTAWSALGTGLGGSVYAMAISGTNLYAGGNFTTAGGNPAANIAKWNGTAWSALGSGVNSWVYALVVSGSDLYAGGYFTTAGGNPASYVAKWNGSAWTALGSGVGSYVYALTVLGSDVYVGGYFSTAGGAPANNIAKWNGSAWSTMGDGLDRDVNALLVSGTDLYAGGYFTASGATPINRVAKWNGTDWAALGSGANRSVLALAASGTNLYVGGDLSIAGNKVSGYAAKAALIPSAPEINLVGNAQSISDGDLTPGAGDHTDFGSVGVTSGSVTRTFTIQNIGDALLSVTAINVTGAAAADFVVGGLSLPATVGSGGSNTFTVTFDPSTSGLRAATVTVVNSDSDEANYDFAIQGTGSTAPEINLTGNSQTIADGDATPSEADHTDFGSAAISGGTVARVFTIQNVGSGTISVTAINLSGAAAADYAVSGLALPASVTGGGSVIFTVTFDPSAGGLRAATVTVANNDSDEANYDFAIQGTGSLFPNGLAAYWIAENNANDSVGASHGTLQGGAGYATGKSGQAFSLDGVDDRVAIPEASAVDLSRLPAWTIVAWVNPTSFANKSWPTIYSEGSWGASLGLNNPSGKLESWINDGSQFIANTALPLNQWSLAALTYDGASRKLYLNGVLDATGSAPAVTDDNGGAAIGAVSTGNAGSTLAGWIDEVMVFNRAVSAQELLDIYNSGNPGTTNQPTLKLMLSGNQAVLSWPSAGSAGFQVEQSATVNAAAWATNNSVINDDNTSKSLTIPLTSSNQYFRLRKP